MNLQSSNKRELILQTALDLIEAEGIKALTQPRIAKASGLRQSHLTYYFPRKADLFIALMEASHRRTKGADESSETSLEDSLAVLFFDKSRMRFFLAIILEIDEDPDLQTVLHQHASGLGNEIARQTGAVPGDLSILAFVDELRGLALRHLFSPNAPADGAALVRDLAKRHGVRLV